MTQSKNGPFICWWASRLLPCPGYYKQCCDEHWATRVSFPSGFLSVYAQQWDCWTTVSSFSLFAMKGWAQMPWSSFFECWVLSQFSTLLFTLIERLFSSSLFSAIREVSSAYLRLLIFLPAILIPACDSSSLAFCLLGGILYILDMNVLEYILLHYDLF